MEDNMRKEIQNVSIEQAQESGVEEIFEIKRQSWISTYATNGVTEDDIKNRIDPWKERQLENFTKMITDHRIGEDQFPGGIWIAKVDGKIVGMVSPMISNGQNRVGAIYILKEYQGMGIGKQLMQKVIDLFKGQDVYLHVQTENQPAIDFYKKWGFEKTHDLPLEYFDESKTKELHQFEMKRFAETK